MYTKLTIPLAHTSNILVNNDTGMPSSEGIPLIKHIKGIPYIYSLYNKNMLLLDALSIQVTPSLLMHIDNANPLYYLPHINNIYKHILTCNDNKLTNIFHTTFVNHIDHISDMHKDYAFWLTYTHIPTHSLNNIPIQHHTYELLHTSISNNPFNIQYIPNQDDNLIDLAISKHPHTIQYIHTPLPHHIHKAITRSADSIQYISKDIIDNHPTLCTLAMQYNPACIQYIPQTIDACLHAIEHNWANIQYINIPELTFIHKDIYLFKEY